MIHVDKFGNAHLNISNDTWQRVGPADGCAVDVVIRGERRVLVEHRLTFGEVEPGAPLLLAEDDGRPALAVNHGSFAARYGVRPGDDIVLEYAVP